MLPSMESRSSAGFAAAAFAVDERPVPAPIRAMAQARVLDTLGCGLAAVAEGAGGAAGEVVAFDGGREEASVLGFEAKIPAAGAALANGLRFHALDFDDTHAEGICHASAVVLPAALAVAEAINADGSALLDAYAIGCEIALRIAVVTAADLYERGFHPTSVCGAFGAAAAAARLFDLDRERAANALGVCGSLASGLLEFLADGSETKPLHAGWAAQAGVRAAQLAAAGASGPASVLEGRFGLLRSHGADPSQSEAMFDALGERWEFERVSVKAFPMCHFAHSSVRAAGDLADEHGLDPAALVRDPGAIAEIAVRVPPEGVALVLDPLVDKHAPRTPYDAKFSLPYAVAHRLLRGELTVESFSDSTIRDPAVLALAAKVRGEELAEEAPSRFAGGARLVLTDGRELDRCLPYPPGAPENPLSDEELRAKFEANASSVLDADQVQALTAQVGNLGEGGGLERLASLMRGAGRAA